MSSSPRSSDLSEKRFGRLFLILLSVGFLALIAAGGSAALMVSRNQEHTAWVNHTQEVERRIYEFSLISERMEAGRRGYMLEPDPRFKSVYAMAAEQLPIVLDTIAHLTSDNPSQRRRVEAMRPLVQRRSDIARGSIAAVDAGAGTLAVQGFRNDESAQLTRRIRLYAAGMVAEESRLLSIRSARQRESVTVFYWIVGLAGALVLFVAAATASIILRYTRDLRRSQDKLQALNDSLESQVRERTLNLRRANEEIQRFAYIVSHDLRAPLVNVMGFTAELEAAGKPLADFIDEVETKYPAILTAEARAAAKEDLPEAIGFIRTSTQKMDRLINAILKLSREGRRTMAPEQVDMSALVRTAADTLRHRTDKVGAEILVEPLPALFSDRFFLDQIFSNLLENAVKYLRPNVPGRIVVSGRREGDRIVFEVADNGRGIDPKDSDRIFDLFRRSGAQDQPGEGIGLAHVRALVYRLGGTIECESALDRGATFRLSFPEQVLREQGVEA